MILLILYPRFGDEWCGIILKNVGCFLHPQFQLLKQPLDSIGKFGGPWSFLWWIRDPRHENGVPWNAWNASALPLVINSIPTIFRETKFCRWRCNGYFFLAKKSWCCDPGGPPIIVCRFNPFVYIEYFVFEVSAYGKIEPEGKIGGYIPVNRRTLFPLYVLQSRLFVVIPPPSHGLDITGQWRLILGQYQNMILLVVTASLGVREWKLVDSSGV